MATFAARRLRDMAENSAGIVAIELLAAAQGIDFRRSAQDQRQHCRRSIAWCARRSPFYDHDRYFAPDITAVQSLVEAGEFHSFVPGLLPSR